MDISFEAMLGMVAVGILAAIGVGLYFRHNMNHVPNAVESTGEVMEIETREVPGTNPLGQLMGGEDKKGDIYYHPIIRFRVDGQKLVRFRNRKGYKDIDAYKVGDQVKVVYNKNNPLVARLVED